MEYIENWVELANAIVLSAAKDYMRAYKRYLRTGEGYEKVMKEESFFLSDWFTVLTSADPVFLLEGMKRKCEAEVKDEDPDVDFEDDEEEEEDDDC